MKKNNNPPETGRVFIYARVSTIEQGKEKPGARNGYGIEAQVAMAKSLIERKLPHCTLACEPIIDVGVSGDVAMWRRKNGGRLFSLLKAGDHLVVGRMDRAFRNAKDFLKTTEELLDMGVRVHYCDIDLDVSTPIGKMVLTILAAVAEFEKKMISIRTKEACANIAGTVHGGQRVYGHTRRVGKGASTPRVHHVERMLGKWVVLMRDERGMSWAEILREFKRLRGSKRVKGPNWAEWNPRRLGYDPHIESKIRWIYESEKELIEEEQRRKAVG